MSKNRARRRRAGIMAAFAAIGLLVTGTLAWQSISQRAVNNAELKAEDPGARLHDDFMEDQDFLLGANKDVYVENYSGQNPDNLDEKGRPVYVRVRFTEYMEMGEGAGLFNVSDIAGDPVDYQNLDRVGTGGTGRTKDDDNHATSVITGGTTPPTILDPKTWTIHIPDPTVADDGTDFHYYWEWDMGGSKIFMPTFNKDSSSTGKGLLTDRTEDAHDQYELDETKTETAYYAEGVTSSVDETHYAKSTLETAAVITMEEWLDLDRPQADKNGNGYWVGDSDGWFYWSKALMPSDATGLLLNGIKMVEDIDEDIYYAIHVTSQMASAGDWGDDTADTGFYKDGITNNALDLLRRAANLQPEVRSISIQEGRRVFVKEGESVTLHADVSVKNPLGDINETLVTWTIDPVEAGNRLTSSGKFTARAGDAENVYTVTATSPALPDEKSDSITVIVIPEDAVGVVESPTNGNTYVDYGDNTFQRIENDGSIDAEFRCAGPDLIIGNGDDFYNIVENADGIRMYGPSEDDGSYIVDGAIDVDVATDGKLTGELVADGGDDVKMWPSPDIDHMGNTPFSGLALGATYTDLKGTEWQVIHKDEDGNSLVMTTSHNSFVKYNTDNEWSKYSESNLMGTLRSFYNDQIGSDVKAGAVPVTIGPNERTGVNTPVAYNSTENATTRPEDISKAGSGTPTADNAVFILSTAEFNTYKDNIQLGGSSWSVRTPGSSDEKPATYLNYKSNTTAANFANGNNIGYRPALWIKE